MKSFASAIIVLLIICFPSLSKAIILGPYTGQVIDSRTGEPVEGASILIYWMRPVFSFEPSSELIKATLVYTDKDGAYKIAGSLANIGLAGILESTHIIIYQPGYQAYIVTIRHDSYSEPDASFKEKNNIVRLDRIPPIFSHRIHYEKIDSALWGIRKYSSGDPTAIKPSITSEESMRLNLLGVPEKLELLRRAEWEERRGRMEKRQ